MHEAYIMKSDHSKLSTFIIAPIDNIQYLHNKAKDKIIIIPLI